VHAAAWASAAGEVLLVREDVGRHNALGGLDRSRQDEWPGPQVAKWTRI